MRSRRLSSDHENGRSSACLRWKNGGRSTRFSSLTCLESISHLHVSCCVAFATDWKGVVGLTWQKFPVYEYVEVRRPSSLSDYEEYALGEMDGDLLPVLEQELEAHLGILEPADKQKAVEWLKGLNRRLLNNFRTKRRHIDTTASRAYRAGHVQPTSTVTPPVAISRANTELEPLGLTPEWSTEEEQLFEISPDTVYAEPFLTTGIGGSFGLAESISLDGFDLDYGHRALVTMEMETSVLGPDSAYGSMSTKESSGCPLEDGDELEGAMAR